MGGGGGDGGFEARQAAVDAKKQLARDALNRQFGVGGSVTRDQFTTPGVAATSDMYGGGGIEGGGDFVAGTPGRPEAFDQAGYDSALASLDTGKAARDGLYQGVRDNAFSSGKRRFDEQKADAGRKLGFELFARGLNGGSEDVNQNALLGRTYSQGLLDLGAKADSAKAQFRGDDESTRLGLLQSIDAGMDQGSAMTSAVNNMQVNADRAASEAQGTTLGDLFANSSLLYNKSQAAQGKQAGTELWNQYNPVKSRAGSVNGTITNIPGQ